MTPAVVEITSVYTLVISQTEARMTAYVLP